MCILYFLLPVNNIKFTEMQKKKISIKKHHLLLTRLSDTRWNCCVGT